VLQCVAVCCSVFQCVAVCCSVLQCVAVCCSLLQCAVVCCNVLYCVAVRGVAAQHVTYSLVKFLKSELLILNLPYKTTVAITFQNFGRSSTCHSHTHPTQMSQKVSPLLNLLHKMTVTLHFDKFSGSSYLSLSFMTWTNFSKVSSLVILCSKVRSDLTFGELIPARCTGHTTGTNSQFARLALTLL